MAAPRRSTRLSIQRQAETSYSSKLDTSTYDRLTNSRHSHSNSHNKQQIWLRARNKNDTIIISSEESSEDTESDCDKRSSNSNNNNKNNNKQKKNNENENVLNKMNATVSRTRKKRETITLEDSPTKQLRIEATTTTTTANSPQVTSPTRLLSRLSIKHNKYQNARRVLNSSETRHLPGREQQLKQLSAFLDEHLQAQRSGSLYISGQPGTGKTACLSLLLQQPQYADNLQCVYINCTSIASVGSVYKKLSDELQLKPQGRTERDHLQAIHAYLRKSPRMLLLVLDEIDQLCTNRQQVLYSIFEWPAIPQARLLLIGIANSLDLTDRALLRLKAHCALQPQLMHFPPYTKQEIVKIFESRLAEADVLNLFPAVTLQLLAAKVSAVSGDVRRALDIGRRVVEMAEQQRNTNIDIKAIEGLVEENLETTDFQPVQVAQVAAVLGNVYGTSQNLEKDLDEAYPLQQKLMLCSLLLIMRFEKNKDISIMRLHEVYKRVCQKRNIHPLDQTEFTGLVDLVETRGIVRLIRKKEPRLSRVVLQWNEEEVNGALCDKQLIASILADRSCLERAR